MHFDFNYLKEDKHIGEQKYFNTEVDFYATKNNLISFGTIRDLIKNSAEYSCFLFSNIVMTAYVQVLSIEGLEFYNPQNLSQKIH